MYYQLIKKQFMNNAVTYTGATTTFIGCYLYNLYKDIKREKETTKEKLTFLEDFSADLAIKSLRNTVNLRHHESILLTLVPALDRDEEFYEKAKLVKDDNIHDPSTRKWYQLVLDREPHSYRDYVLTLRDIENDD